jgi:Uma2 family endonuclease
MTMSAIPTSSIDLAGVEPAWEIALLFPPQGQWSEAEYLKVTESTNQLVELTDGKIRVLEMPTTAHQMIVEFLLDAFRAFIKARKLGRMLFAPLRVKVRENKFREPDLMFMRRGHFDRAGEDYWEGADLVVEVVSNNPDGRTRDLVEKRLDYAEAGIPEYWIVDPARKQVTVLVLRDGSYATLGEFRPGQEAASELLEGFSVDVAEVFQAAESLG